MKLFERISNKLFQRECRKTNHFEVQKERMIKPLAGAFKVFRKPGFALYSEDYKGEPKYFTVKGVKLFKIPNCFVCTEWKYTDISYDYRYGEFNIRHLPSAEAVRWGQHLKLTTKIPVTNTTNPLNYWTSVLEFFDGRGAHKGNLGKTIEKLGTASMGVQFDEYNPHVFELIGDDMMAMPSFGNSMYFVVDRNYINTAHLHEYDFAVERIKKNESPMLI